MRQTRRAAATERIETAVGIACRGSQLTSVCHSGHLFDQLQADRPHTPWIGIGITTSCLADQRSNRLLLAPLYVLHDLRIGVEQFLAERRQGVPTELFDSQRVLCLSDRTAMVDHVQKHVLGPRRIQLARTDPLEQFGQGGGRNRQLREGHIPLVERPEDILLNPVAGPFRIA